MKDLARGMIVFFRSPRQGLAIPVVRQFIKFSMVGVVNTATSFSVYGALTRLAGFDPLVANALSFVAAVTVSFTLNKRWTFRDTSRQYRRQYSMFLGVSFGGLVLSESIILLLHTVGGLHDLVAFAAAVVVVMFWNFGGNRRWTFAP